MKKQDIIMLPIMGVMLPEEKNVIDSMYDTTTVMDINFKILRRVCMSLDVKIVLLTEGDEFFNIDFETRYKHSRCRYTYTRDNIKEMIGKFILESTRVSNEKIIKHYIQDNDIGKVIVLGKDSTLKTSCNPGNHSHFIEVNDFLSNKVVNEIASIIES